MLIVGYCFGIRSERRLCEEVHLNLSQLALRFPPHGRAAAARLREEISAASASQEKGLPSGALCASPQPPLERGLELNWQR